MLTVGSLFAGIGGFDLGLERAGMRVRWQVEIDPWCQRILAKHWPDVTRYGDIRTVDWSTVEPVDLLCGGFPCQDISLAGKGAGLTGERSGLWFEYAKAIAALRPRYVLIENVAALRARGLDQVLGSLAALGYDAEWHCIPACAVGAPHRRDRVWIVAYSNGQRQRQPEEQANASGNRGSAWMGTEVCNCGRCELAPASYVADAECERLQGGGENGSGERSTGLCGRAWKNQEQDIYQARSGWWSTEPAVGRVAHGIPSRVDRLRGLGNAIVPQIAEWLGRQIMKAQEDSYDQSRTREAGTVLS